MDLKRHRPLLALVLALAIVPAGATGAGGGSREKAEGPVRVVIGVESGHERDVRHAAEEAGIEISERGRKGRFLVAEVASSKDAAEAIGMLEGDEGVAYADVDRMVSALYAPNDPSFSSQWHLPKIGAPFAWDTTRGDPSVKIAIIDTGVDLDHRDLADNIDTANDWDFVNDDANADDDEGHGTHVAGIAAAAIDNGVNGAGVAPLSTILPMKALNAAGMGWESDIADAIIMATDEGADVVNMSLGSGYNDPGMEAAVEYAVARGVVVVAAAGNSATSAPTYPAAYAGVVGVSATTSSDTRASFSNYGNYVDLAAPGVNIVSTKIGGGTERLSGTSMASPVVAGAAALVRAQHPAWSASQVVQSLKDSAADLGQPGRDDSFGYGRVNVGDAADTEKPDNEIPGQLLLSSPVPGRVNATSDPHDVYAVTTEASKTLTLRVTGDANTDVDVRLLSPASVDLTNAVVVAQSTGSSYPKTISYFIEPGTEGTYYIDISTTAGSGGYSLTWAHGYPTSASLSGASLVSWGGSPTLGGKVLLTTGEPVPPTMLLLEAKPYGGSWSVVAMPITAADGSFSAKVSPTKRTDYRVVMVAHDGLLSATSPAHTIQLRAYLTRPSAPASVRRGSVFTSAGYLKPRHTSGRRDVKISCYRSESGTWKLRKTVYATNANYSSYTRYSARLSLPYGGRWKMVASVAGNSTHVATTSSARYLTVK